MRLTHLRAVNFRNHPHSDLAPSPGINVLLGGNAQGKSSLLEAARLTSTGRSFRAQHDVEMIAFGADWTRVRAAVVRGARHEEIDVTLGREEPAGAGGARREIRVNGVPVRRAELFGHLLAVMAAPEDAEVVNGSPVHRRRLVDLLLAQVSSAYFHDSQRYARAVLQRNRLLRMHSTSGLDAWDEQVAILGAAVTVRRRNLVARVAAAAAPVYGVLTQGREVLELEYAPSLYGQDEAALAADARDALRRRRGEEIARGVTLAGPHRDDLRLRVDGRDLKTFGSRGQQLSAMLAVRLAERRVLREETGEEPVMLLDDILLTLDEARQAYLMESLRGVQALMTATALAGVAGLPAEAALFQVRDGTVEVTHADLA